MTLLRLCPSGPRVIITGGGDVFSVFSRTGHVVAEFFDYDSNSVSNASTVSGASLAEALTVLLTTTGIANQSLVPGSTVTDALDELLRLSLSSAGALHDSFMGGRRTATTSLADGRFGDHKWNYVVFGLSDLGASIIKRTGESGATGIYRITSPFALDAAANIYLGSLTHRPFEARSWRECTWRCRFDSAQAINEACQVGVAETPDMLLTSGSGAAGFLGKQVGAGSSANYQSVTGAGGSSVAKNTGVPIDALFHDFRVVRSSDEIVQFFIDGSLVTTHDSNSDPLPTATTGLTPIAGAVGGGSGAPATTFIDVDDYSFIPR